MDAFDEIEAKPVPPARSSSGLFWNILTTLVLLTAAILGLFFLAIFQNPNMAFNPWPPPTEIPVIIVADTPTITPTSRAILPATWTPSPTSLPSDTPTATITPTPTDTQTPGITPSATVTAGPSPTSPKYSFVIHQGSPQAIANIAHQDLGCSWMGVAGQAFSLNGAPVLGLFIQVGGTLEGQPIEGITMTGTALEYGKGGYEYQLGSKPVDSSNTIWIQLMDMANLPLSDKVYFKTFASCDKNLILVNFTQVK